MAGKSSLKTCSAQGATLIYQSLRNLAIIITSSLSTTLGKRTELARREAWIWIIKGCSSESKTMTSTQFQASYPSSWRWTVRRNYRHWTRIFNPLEINRAALSTKVTIIIKCLLAPNIIVRFSRALDHLPRLVIVRVVVLRNSAWTLQASTKLAPTPASQTRGWGKSSKSSNCITSLRDSRKSKKLIKSVSWRFKMICWEID